MNWRPRRNEAIHRFHSLRLVSIVDRRVELLLVGFEFAADVEITLEGRWIAAASRLEIERRTNGLSVWRARNSRFGLARATEAAVEIAGGDSALALDASGQRWRWRASAGQRALFHLISSYARADGPDRDPSSSAEEGLGAARRIGWAEILSLHEREWAERWLCSEVELAGDDAAQRALRFAAYHLVSAANPDDPHVSIGARGLTGDEYFGHVLWDTEVFLLPFYILTWPQAARSLLAYRYRTLGSARGKASRLGWRGAFYAWESTRSGAETAPDHAANAKGEPVEIFTGRNEAHISADVAWAVWRYWRATQDDAFLVEMGGEILFETARFWASRAERGPDGRSHIRDAEGPDEYHPNVDDNAFTNVMARWNLLRALNAAALFQARWPQQSTALSTRLSLGERELAAWKEVADTLATGLNEETGLYEQFAGFFELERVDLDRYAGRDEPMDVVLGEERTHRSQVLKQADVGPAPGHAAGVV